METQTIFQLSDGGSNPTLTHQLRIEKGKFSDFAFLLEKYHYKSSKIVHWRRKIAQKRKRTRWNCTLALNALSATDLEVTWFVRIVRNHFIYCVFGSIVVWVRKLKWESPNGVGCRMGCDKIRLRETIILECPLCDERVDQCDDSDRRRMHIECCHSR